MAMQSPAYAIQGAAHSAALFRQASSSLVLQGGPLGSAEYVVAAQGTPNMSVSVAAGRAWIPGTQVATISGQHFSTQAMYFALNDAPATVTISAADATNPRIDVVYAAVQDAYYSGSNNTAVLGVVTGTPAASPAAPAVPSNALALAQISVAANATSITSGNVANITGQLAVVKGGTYVGQSTTRPTSAYIGQGLYETNTGRELVLNSTTWQYVGGNPPPTFQCGPASGWSVVSGNNVQAYVDGSGLGHITGVISNTNSFTPASQVALTLPTQVPYPISGGSFGVLYYDSGTGAIGTVRCQWNSSSQLLIVQGPAIAANSYFYLGNIAPWHPTAPGSGVLA